MTSRWLPPERDRAPVLCTHCCENHCSECETYWCGCLCRLPGGRNYISGSRED